MLYVLKLYAMLFLNYNYLNNNWIIMIVKWMLSIVIVEAQL